MPDGTLSPPVDKHYRRTSISEYRPAIRCTHGGNPPSHHRILTESRKHQAVCRATSISVPLRYLAFVLGLFSGNLVATPTPKIPLDLLSPSVNGDTRAGVSAATSDALTVPTLAELLPEAEKAEKDLRTMREHLAAAQRREHLAANVEAMERVFKLPGSPGSALTPEQATIVELLDLDTDLEQSEDDLSPTIDDLVDTAKRLDTDLDRIGTEVSLWRQRRQWAGERGSPQALIQRALEMEVGFEGLAAQMKPERDTLLILLDRATRVRSRSEAFRSELTSRRSRLDRDLRHMEAKPIWEMDWNISPTAVEGARSALIMQAKAVQKYLRLRGALLGAIFSGLYMTTFVFLTHMREAIRAESVADIHANEALHVFEKRTWAALLIALLGVWGLAPEGPVAFDTLFWCAIPIPAMVLSAAEPRRHFLLTPIVLTTILVLVPLQTSMEFVPFVDRLLLIGQVGFAACALMLDLRAGRIRAAFPRTGATLLNLLTYALITGLTVTLLSNVLGFVGLSRLLRSTLLGMLALGVVAISSVHAFYGILVAALRTRVADTSLIVRRHRSQLQRLLRRAILVIAVLCLGDWVMDELDLGAPIYDWWVDVSGRPLGIGDLTIAMGPLITGAAVLVGTYGLVQAARLLLEQEIFPRTDLTAGMRFTVSAAVRYSVAVVGVMLALGAAGIDLSKIVLLLGAVGIGLGFGLQNLVNNFIAGLILIFERPIHVGDAVQIDSMIGEIRHIGVRSSLLRTADGADVLLPNGDLLSKGVTNWTRSDRHKRLDIDVQTVAGANVGQVIGMLENLAQKQDGILRDPAPSVLLLNCGQGSLDFRLYVWVDRFEDADRIGSDLRRSILEKLRESDLESQALGAIPMPTSEQ